MKIKPILVELLITVVLLLLIPIFFSWRPHRRVTIEEKAYILSNYNGHSVSQTNNSCVIVP